MLIRRIAQVKMYQWAAGVGGLAAGGYLYDRYWQASACTRTLRTFRDIAMICLDYKLNFRPERGSTYLAQIHDRTARRLLQCCQENGGLFIKFGQSIAIQSSLLPSPFRQHLSVLYDQAPSVDHIEEVLQRYGLDDMFVEFERPAKASASVAQVHRARLREYPGQLVAVKIQKPQIRKQIKWDLFAFRTCAQIIEYAFGIPLMWSVGEVERRLAEELDFEREAHNSQLAANDLLKLADSPLRDSVYIPRVIWQATNKEVLTTEWIGGTSLVDPQRLRAEGWELEHIMRRMCGLFGFQIFVSGNVHGDPHPGNILVRPNPQSPQHPQLVLLDHGLYVRESPTFKQQYARFWQAAQVADRRAMSEIVHSWGVADAEMLSTLVSLKPPQLDAGGYEGQMEFKRRAIGTLHQSRDLPPELVFVTRNMNIVRSNNQSLGTPVDRVRMMGRYAAWGLRKQLVEKAWSFDRRYRWPQYGVTPSQDHVLSRVAGALKGEWGYLSFRLSLCMADLSQALYRWWRGVCSVVIGIEDTYEDALGDIIEQKLGYQIDMSLFRA